MHTSEIRQEIHNYIDQADSRVLNLIYGLIKADSKEETYELSSAHKKVLDERLASHKFNPSTVSTWEEIKTQLSNHS